MLIENQVKFENNCLLITQRIEEGDPVAKKAKQGVPILQKLLSSSLKATLDAYSKAGSDKPGGDGGPGGSGASRDPDGGVPGGKSGAITNIFGPFILFRGTCCCQPEVKNVR